VPAAGCQQMFDFRLGLCALADTGRRPYHRPRIQHYLSTRSLHRRSEIARPDLRIHKIISMVWVSEVLLKFWYYSRRRAYACRRGSSMIRSDPINISGESRDQSTTTKRDEGQSVEVPSDRKLPSPANAPPSVIPQTVCKALWVVVVVS